MKWLILAGLAWIVGILGRLHYLEIRDQRDRERVADDAIDAKIRAMSDGELDSAIAKNIGDGSVMPKSSGEGKD